MYACIAEIGSEFFEEGCDKEDWYLLLKTHPPPCAIRGWFYVSPACPVVLGAVNSYSLPPFLVPSKKPQGGQ
jgi:hypothetical protein